jgi:hypothetical protein
LWLPGGEIIHDVNEDPPLRKISAEKLVRNAILGTAGRSSTTAGKTSSDPSIPPAESSTASSINPSAEAYQLPTDFRTS